METIEYLAVIILGLLVLAIGYSLASNILDGAEGQISDSQEKAFNGESSDTIFQNFEGGECPECSVRRKERLESWA